MKILMIEDDADDRYITEKYFTDNGFNAELNFFSGAGNIISHLSSLPEDQLPNLIILSPGKKGLQTLREIKTHPQFGIIPVVVLSEDTHTSVVYDAYRLGANSVIQKPSTHQLTQEKIETFAKYWFNTVELP